MTRSILEVGNLRDEAKGVIASDVVNPSSQSDPADGGTKELPVTLIRPPGRAISLELGELWYYRELLVLPGLARPQGALQADRAGRGVGRHPAAS